MKYYYIIDGTTYGPETKKQIDERKLAGQIPLDVELLEAKEEKKSPFPINKYLANILLFIVVCFLAFGIVEFFSSLNLPRKLSDGALLILIPCTISYIFWSICGKIAEEKRLDAKSYKILGALTWFLGLIIVLSIPQREEKK